MNINQFKRSMDEIVVNEIEMDKLLKRSSKKLTQVKYTKLISAFVLTLILVFCLANFTRFYGNSYGDSIRVYAAEKKTELTKDFIKIKLDSIKVDGGSNSSYCFMNYNLKLHCEGNNINTITYTCADQKISKNNRLSASVYFVENISVPENEYAKYLKDDNFIFGYKAEGENIASITKLIGNSYTVNYEDQNNKQYGVVLAGTVDKSGTYQFEDTIIKLDITLNDGTLLHKQLIINSANENSYSEIKLRVL